jgi:hypothetical protein
MILFPYLLLFWQIIGKIQIGFYIAIYWISEIAILPFVLICPKKINLNVLIFTTFSKMVKVVEIRHKLQ